LHPREHLLRCDPDIFAQTFNRLPHEVSHTLAAHPLFQIPALAKLAQKVAAREDPHYAQGDIHVEQQEADSNKRTDPAIWADGRLAKLVQDIEQGKTWIILKHIEREPEYQQIFEACIGDILDLAHGEIVKNIRWFEAVLFITSPNRVTNYHIDRECSWLLQIQGNKEIHLFDRADQDVLPDEELERYWIANHRFSAVYRPEYESRAMVHQLRPGTGVHIPVNTPHWLQNGANVSVSISVNFQFQDRAWENLYKANYYLRRAGLPPAPPGKNLFADRLKRGAYSTVQEIQRRVKRLPRVPTSEARKYYHRIVELRASREI
jgi:hypothetical protein